MQEYIKVSLDILSNVDLSMGEKVLFSLIQDSSDGVYQLHISKALRIMGCSDVSIKNNIKKLVNKGFILADKSGCGKYSITVK